MNELLTYISSNNLAGIPMDIVAHFLVGMIFIILGLVLRVQFGVLLLGLLFLTTVKEMRDFIVYSSPILETMKDYFFSFLYAFILIPVRIRLKGDDWIN
jgi:hypothetical protein